MAAFGSFALLIALALAAYNLLAGSVALRLIATSHVRRVSINYLITKPINPKPVATTI